MRPEETALLVIVAIDGSAAAALGVRLVARASWPEGTTIRVVHAVDPTPAAIIGPYGAAVLTQTELMKADAREAAMAALEAARAELARAQLHVECSTLRGRAALAIVEAARELHADLIVVGSRGHGMIERMLLGSVSAEIVDHSTVPVLVARGDRLDRVVFAWDGSECAARAGAVLEWPAFAQSSISIIGVSEPEFPWWASFAEAGAPDTVALYAEAAAASRREHQRLIDAKVTELNAAGLRPRAEVRTGDPGQELIAAARDAKADLVLMGTRGRSGVAKLLLGSVARNVLHHTACSVLIAR
jgi:nucleotide-binding universal stress UspA family protein